ncbi:MAG: DUF3793 family protein [Verrucomicrobiota bacterium]|nr:DUF3793 family protein [Verrucomicrobiota bacterium]
MGILQYLRLRTYEEELRFLIIKLAPLLAGKKPSVLLCLRNKEDNKTKQNFSFFSYYSKEIKEKLGVSACELRTGKNSALVLFYSQNLLYEAIMHGKERNFLYKNGYRNCCSIDENLCILKKKFNKEKIPHEIGLFLGYPYKDVIGFVEKKERSQPVKKGLWKVYGNAEVSLNLMNSYKSCMNIAKKMVANASVYIILAQVQRQWMRHL